MNRFSKVITTNEMSIKAELPLPNRPKYSRLAISFDKFNEFINRYLSGSIRLPLLQATIYDEDVIKSQEDINLRYQFLRKINELNFKKISFRLSDSTADNIYICICNPGKEGGLPVSLYGKLHKCQHRTDDDTDNGCKECNLHGNPKAL